MFKNKNADGSLNICGRNIKFLRQQRLKISQKALADKMQLQGMDMGKNAIQQIESGNRFVTDIEIKAFAELFGVTADDLLK